MYLIMFRPAGWMVLPIRLDGAINVEIMMLRRHLAVS
jgi:hypothetical protein